MRLSRTMVGILPENQNIGLAEWSMPERRKLLLFRGIDSLRRTLAVDELTQLVIVGLVDFAGENLPPVGGD